jgi:hypothetical protein
MTTLKAQLFSKEQITEWLSAVDPAVLQASLSDASARASQRVDWLNANNGPATIEWLRYVLKKEGGIETPPITIDHVQLILIMEYFLENNFDKMIEDLSK